MAAVAREPIPFKLVYSDPRWYPFIPFRLVLDRPDSGGEPDPEYYKCFHEIAFYFRVERIGSWKLGKIFQRQWPMIRCVLTPSDTPGDPTPPAVGPITVYLRARSPLPWYLIPIALAHRVYVLVRDLIDWLRGRAPIGTGSGTVFGSSSLAGNRPLAPAHHPFNHVDFMLIDQIDL